MGHGCGHMAVRAWGRQWPSFCQQAQWSVLPFPDPSPRILCAAAWESVHRAWRPVPLTAAARTTATGGNPPSACWCAVQVASKPGVTVGELQREFARWEEGYDSSSAAAGPAKRRLRNEFVRGTYQQLLANVERAHSQRLLEAERGAKEVRALSLVAPELCMRAPPHTLLARTAPRMCVVMWSHLQAGLPVTAQVAAACEVRCMRNVVIREGQQNVPHCVSKELAGGLCRRGNTIAQDRQRAEDDRRAVAAARAEAERERLSRERLEQQVTGHHSKARLAPAPAQLEGLSHRPHFAGACRCTEL